MGLEKSVRIIWHSEIIWRLGDDVKIMWLCEVASLDCPTPPPSNVQVGANQIATNDQSVKEKLKAG